MAAAYVLLVFFAQFYRPVHSVGLYDRDPGRHTPFCYSENDPDCPGPSRWGGHCQKPRSTRQSPINLPLKAVTPPSRFHQAVDVILDGYDFSNFRLKNNGHTVAIQFPSERLSNVLHRWNGNKHSEYVLDGAHFHWGSHDYVGSEHCLAGRCFSGELHLVHYRSDFEGLVEAVQSGDPDALVVLGIFLQASKDQEKITGDFLNPMFRNLGKVRKPSINSKEINRPLRFSGILNQISETGKHLYTYRGSLTTPECDEQVIWYVAPEPVYVNANDVALFRELEDHRGMRMQKNHRNLQSVNNRAIVKATLQAVGGTVYLQEYAM